MDSTAKWANPLAAFQPSNIGPKTYLARAPLPPTPAAATPKTSRVLAANPTPQLSALAIEPTFLQRVSDLQSNTEDPEMVRLKKRAQSTDADFYITERHSMPLIYRRANTGPQLVIPSTCRELLLQESHNAALSGHFGANKMLRVLQARVWWPYMKRTVQRFVQACQIC